MYLIDRAIGQLFRSLESRDRAAPDSSTMSLRPRPRPRTGPPTQSPTDLRPEYTQRIGGLSLTDFKLLVLIPAAIVRLIQADEECRTGTHPTFEEAVEISKSTAKVGELLYPESDDDEDEAPLSAEFIAARLFKEEESENED